MKDKLIHGCFFVAFATLMLSLYFVISDFSEAEKREKIYQEHIKECNRRIEAMRREYEKINSPDWDEFIILEDVNFNYPV